ncbi:unnamed protein product [Lathyrus oleraceus]
MSITLDDVLCLLHFSIMGRLLDHGRIMKYEAHQMMVDYLGVDAYEENDELDMTRDAHARFEYLNKVYETEILRVEKTVYDDEQVALHRAHALRACLLYLVGTSNFVDKSANYTDVIYLQYFLDFEQIHEYN